MVQPKSFFDNSPKLLYQSVKSADTNTVAIVGRVETKQRNETRDDNVSSINQEHGHRNMENNNGDKPS